MREPNSKRVNADVDERVVHKLEYFEIGRYAVGADGVEIALHELPVAPPLSVFAPPNLRDVVALERKSELRCVLRDKTRKRNGQIKSQRDVTIPMVVEPIDLLVRFPSAFPEEYL